MNYNQIYPGLWLGDYHSAVDNDFIKNNNISLIINCTMGIPSIRDKNVKVLRLSVEDNPSDFKNLEIMFLNLPKYTKIIHENLCSGKNILVHCHAGKQRSFAVIVAFFAKYTNLPLDHIIDLIKTKRPIAGSPQVNFYPSLYAFCKELK